MKAVLHLELIGDNLYAYKRAARRGQIRKELRIRDEINLLRLAPDEKDPRVSRLTRCAAAPGFTRQILPPSQKDYADANSEGSRGVYGYWILDGGVYEVTERLNWKKARTYYIRVEGDQITEISRQEVYQWLNAAT